MGDSWVQGAGTRIAVSLQPSAGGQQAAAGRHECRGSETIGRIHHESAEGGEHGEIASGCHVLPPVGGIGRRLPVGTAGGCRGKVGTRGRGEGETRRGGTRGRGEGETRRRGDAKKGRRGDKRAGAATAFWDCPGCGSRTLREAAAGLRRPSRRSHGRSCVPDGGLRDENPADAGARWESRTSGCVRSISSSASGPVVGGAGSGRAGNRRVTKTPGAVG